MPISLWKELVNDVQPEVATCPKFTIINEIRRAAIKFCKESGVWEVELRTFVPANIGRVILDPPDGARIQLVTEVTDEYGSMDRDCYSVTSTSEDLILPPAPENRWITVSVILKPTRKSEGMPESVIEDHGNIIAYGAIASIKAMSGQVWEDLTGAQIKKMLFDDGVADAKVDKLRGGVKRPLRVKSRSFF